MNPFAGDLRNLLWTVLVLLSVGFVAYLGLGPLRKVRAQRKQQQARQRQRRQFWGYE